MGFSSETFLFLFLPLFILAYIIVSRSGKQKLQNLVLIAINIFFYAWSSLDTLVIFILLVIFVFILGNLIHYSRLEEKKSAAKKCLYFSAILLVALLVYYKYTAFIVQQINLIPQVNISVRVWAAPIGISFLVFESISYIADIHRGEAGPGSFTDVLLFLSLFPKLISGPIVRWKDFQPQIASRPVLSGNIAAGIDRIIIGLAKKVIIADTLGAQISRIDSDLALSGIDSPTFWLRAILYFFQIYYDFSGYSDIAIGLCRIFGFDIKENFNFPYISTSVTEFWRRWHISLGTWFRNYVYIPMGGNRRGNVYLHLFIVFLLTGIWHGDNWTFIIWGAVNGGVVVLERLIRNRRWYQKVPGILKWLATMAIVFFAWVVFSAPDLPGVGVMFKGLFGNAGFMGGNFTWRFYLTKRIAIILAVAAAGSVIGAIPRFEAFRSGEVVKKTAAVRRIVLLGLFVIALLFAVNSTYSPFIYFQF